MKRMTPAALAAALRREGLRTARMMAPVLGPKVLKAVPTLAQYRATVELLRRRRAKPRT
jgi:hypothetical protein